ncbi:hypothetical protein lerEdw1_003050 [Lerista edwardsae]|nr:hypothetical protein lerEdw1_003050 [Lerista edwardsae]
MKMMLISLLIFVNVWGSRAGEDLEKKLFVFPTATKTAHVVLNAKLPQALTAFTVCLRLYTDLTRLQTVFSYASKRQANEIVVDRTSSTEYRLYVGNDYASFKRQGGETYFPVWEHICMSWETVNGLAMFSLNGRPFPLKGLRKGYTVSTEASIILGQDQDNFGGGFNANQCFVGEVKDVYMFGRLLSSDEVNLLMIGSRLPQNDALIDWTALSYNVTGYVVVWPATFWTY